MKWKFLLAALLAAVAMGCGQREYMMPKAPPTPQATFVDQMRTKCNGDVTKLTPDERKKMDEITRGMTEAIIKMGPPKPGETSG